jgi:hypothetical protein
VDVYHVKDRRLCAVHTLRFVTSSASSSCWKAFLIEDGRSCVRWAIAKPQGLNPRDSALRRSGGKAVPPVRESKPRRQLRYGPDGPQLRPVPDGTRLRGRTPKASVAPTTALRPIAFGRRAEFVVRVLSPSQAIPRAPRLRGRKVLCSAHYPGGILEPRLTRLAPGSSGGFAWGFHGARIRRGGTSQWLNSVPSAVPLWQKG